MATYRALQPGASADPLAPSWDRQVIASKRYATTPNPDGSKGLARAGDSTDTSRGFFSELKDAIAGRVLRAAKGSQDVYDAELAKRQAEAEAKAKSADPDRTFLWVGLGIAGLILYKRFA